MASAPTSPGGESGSPDISIVSHLCLQALPHHTLNIDLLRNWQAELSDAAGNGELLANAIQQEVILLYPHATAYCGRTHRDALAECLRRTNALEDDVYLDFKLIMYLLVFHATTTYYTTKIQLHRLGFTHVLLDDFLEHVHTLDDGSDQQRALALQKFRILVSFMELGCDVKLLKKLVIPLFGKSSRVGFGAKNWLLKLLIAVLELYPSQFPFLVFNSFVGRPASMPFLCEAAQMKCLTVQSWFKINAPTQNSAETTVTTLFMLAASSGSDSSVMKVELVNYKQFMVAIQNQATGSRIQLTFNHIIDLASCTNQGFTHFALTYDNYQNLNLFIDGEYSESIPCSALSKFIESWNKLYVGHAHDDSSQNIFARDELLIKDLTVLDISLPYEWVTTFYLLGIGFDWTYKEFTDENIVNLVNNLLPYGLVRLGFRAREISDMRAQSRSSAKLRHQSSLSSMRISASKRQNFEAADKKAIAALLLKSRIKKANILFEFNSLNLVDYLDRPKSLEILFHQPDSVYGSLYCLGGAGLLVTLIEVISKDTYDTEKSRSTLFYNSMAMLLQCLQNNWRINKEFENLDGFWILTLLINYYKDSYNHNLSFEAEEPLGRVVQKSSLTTSNDSYLGSNQRSLLSLFLAFSGCGPQGDHESIIYNPFAYKSLVLSFDLYSKTSDYALLHEHIRLLIQSGKYTSYNVKELTKVKLLKRIIQHIKTEIIINSLGSRNLDELVSTLTVIINSDITVETIRSVSQFIIFALYGLSRSDASEKLGLESLQALTDKLCDSTSSIKLLKKFSRSVTIHWILLLLSYLSDNKPLAERVVRCGISLLAKLLRVLGPHIIKRFFQSNKGLDVLTYFLQNWWNSDAVMSLLFLASFGIESFPTPVSELTLPAIARDPITKSVKLLMVPEFMVLINNLALTGVSVLGQKQGRVLSAPSSPIRDNSKGTSLEDEVLDTSFNVLHLVNQLSEVVELGNTNSTALQSLFVSKDWLDGTFELMAHLKLSAESTSLQLRPAFRKCLEKYVSAITAIFIPKLFHIKQLFGVLKNVNDISAKLALDAVYPHMFKHISEFITNSNFIYKEKDFVNGSIELLKHYHNDFVMQNFYIAQDDLEKFLSCAISIVESGERDEHIAHQLGPLIGNALVLWLAHPSFPNSNNPSEMPELEGQFARELDRKIKVLLYKQIIILNDAVLSNVHLGQLIEIVMGCFCKLSPETQMSISEHVLNFLRTSLMMRSEAFDKIINQLASFSDYQNSSIIVREFFELLTSRNDEDTIRHLQKSPTLRHIFNKNYHFRMSKLKEIGSIRVMDMVTVMFNGGGTLGFMDNVYIKSFEKDCETLKVLTINGELVKYNRELQDKQENNIFFESSFNMIKLEIIRLLSEFPTKSGDYTLDYIEGVDRMRKLLVLEDQLLDSDKLSYTVAVPIKQVDTIVPNNADYDNYSFAFAHSGIDTLSLSENPLLGSEIEDYEEVDDINEAESANPVNEDRNRKVIRSLYMGDQIQTIFNVSRINGLDAVESLMILGFSHLYLIENYFHCADGNVVDVQEAPSELRDPYLQLIKSQSDTSQASKTHRTRSWTLETLSSITKRKFLLRDIALEMFFSDGASILITCFSKKQRDSIHAKLSPYATGKGLDKDLAQTLGLSSSALQIANNNGNSGSFFTTKLAFAFSNSFSNSAAFLNATRKWRMGKMSNFYYLMTINTLAGRTFNDLTQYPVFPWVIADYESEELDLSDPKSFRDLSKPMGAQTGARADQFRERYDALNSLHDENAPAFHYGTHYSSAMIVASYLIRLKPYVQSYLLLQGGKFDHADRLFNSVGKAWLSASRDNTTDIRELIPEFFYLPEFLSNHNNFEFGKLQNGETANDVNLPTWAKGDPNIFISKNREALESPYVSANLHRWIDLVFGYKQNGDEAVKALNVFHHLSYDGAIDLDNINDEVEKRAVIGMINNFGQTPLKVFSKPHPVREVLNLPNLYLSPIDVGTAQRTFESKLNLPIEKLEISTKTRKWIGRPACTSSEDLLLIRKPSPYKSQIGTGSLVINTTLFMNLHLANISAVVQLGNGHFVTGSDDGIIHVWKCSSVPTLSVTDHHILRGHFSAIRSFAYSKTFKVCLSVDADGGVILWDFVRFKFIRRVVAPSDEHVKVLAAISNDSGHFCTVTSTKFANTLAVHTLNGERILETELGPGTISALAVPAINDLLVEPSRSDAGHAYWSSFMVAICYASPQRVLRIYEVVAGAPWRLQPLQSIDLAAHVSSAVTALAVIKQTDVDGDEKLSRGRLAVVLGDAGGRVYVM